MPELTKEQLTELFRKLGVDDPEGWASADIREGLSNLPKVAFLRQAWAAIPGADDVDWLEQWMSAASRGKTERAEFAAYQRVVGAGAAPSDLVLLLREAMGNFLYRLAYLLDDPSLDDEDLAEFASWGLYSEIDEEPRERLGCIHELVRSVEPCGPDA